jgi:HAE1 family hydrophobic/amphiphilic exporter-1
MNLWRIPATRPVAVMMMFTGIIIMGLLSWRRLEVELLPDISLPRISVTTAYRNVAPEEIENLITRPIEEALGATTGVERISSTSSEGVSVVVAQFRWGQDMDFAALAVREKVDLIKGFLPEDAEEPIVSKYDPATAPIITLALTGEVGLADLREMAERKVVPFLERIEGVAAVSVSGGLVREIVVEVDQGRLYAYGLGLEDVAKKIEEANYSFPAGTIERGETEYLIRTVGEYERASDINSVVVGRSTKGIPVYLKDVGRAVDSFKERVSLARLDGAESVGLAVRKEAGENTVKVIEQIRGKLPALENELGVRIGVVSDQSDFIKGAIRSVGSAAVNGALLAFVVLLAFLASIRSAAIIAAAIPISILATFGLMGLSEISLNLMSLGGLALAVGMLVDNSIVVLESIDRKRKMGLDAKEAAAVGAKEVGMAVLSSTLTTVAVFGPLVYVEGVAGVLFGQLGLTVTFGLLSSLAVAVVLVPTLSASEAGWGSGRIRAFAFVERWVRGALDRLDGLYVRVLRWSLRKRAYIVLGVATAFGGSVLAGVRIPLEFLPEADRGEFRMKVTLPKGRSIEDAAGEVVRIEEYLKSRPEVEMIYSTVGLGEESEFGQGTGTGGPNEAEMIVKLRKRRTLGLKEFIGEIRSPIEGMVVGKIEYRITADVLGSLFAGGAPVAVEVSGQDLTVLERVGNEVARVMEEVPGLTDVETTSGEGQPEARVRLDREKMASYQLTVKEAADALQIAIRGKVATTFRDGDRDVDVRVRLRPQDRQGVADLRRILINTPLGAIPLDKLGRLEVTRGSSRILRQDQRRVALVTANVEGRKVGRALDDLNAALTGYIPPPGYTVLIRGEREAIAVSFGQMRFVLILSVALIYMIMAAQFESLLQPFIVMLTVPLGFIGGVAGLALSRSALSLPAFIGGIMLSGIIVNNAIVLIDYANVLRSGKGLSPGEAVVEAGRVRLRPILMTTLTTVMGLIPLALGIGEEAKLQSPMAATVIGGMFVGTLLTLVFIPIVYTTIEEALRRWKLPQGTSGQLS